jgi:hypothetical protein
VNAPGESPGAIFRSMAGKLIVSFDFVDEKGNLIVKAPHFNTMITPVIQENVSVSDYIDMHLYLTDCISRFARYEQSPRLFPHIPVPIALEERHNNQCCICDSPNPEHPENCK